MFQMHGPIMTQHRLLLFKWLIVFTPSVTLLAGHSLLGYLLGYSAGHSLVQITATRLAENLLVAFLLLVLSYIFVETVFRVIRKLEIEALAREQDIQTISAVMKERERLSRELHDGVAQLVADLLLRLDTIKDLVATDRQYEAEIELERLHGVANEIFVDIGESITGLRANVTERGLIGALQDYVDQFEERHQLPVSFIQMDEAADRLSPAAALQIFRFIQEALTNVRKHAKARKVTLSFMSTGSNHLKIVVADDGQGFTRGNLRNGQGKSLGLTSMRERVESLGGTFHVNSHPGLGTQVTATIPIPGIRKKYGLTAVAPPAR